VLQTVAIPRELIAGQLEVGQERPFPWNLFQRGTTITVSWSSVAGAIGYAVLVNRSGGASPSLPRCRPRSGAVTA
jgi:hypothetical protein